MVKNCKAMALARSHFLICVAFVLAICWAIFLPVWYWFHKICFFICRIISGFFTLRFCSLPYHWEITNFFIFKCLSHLQHSSLLLQDSSIRMGYLKCVSVTGFIFFSKNVKAKQLTYTLFAECIHSTNELLSYNLETF